MLIIHMSIETKPCIRTPNSYQSPVNDALLQLEIMSADGSHDQYSMDGGLIA